MVVNKHAGQSQEGLAACRNIPGIFQAYSRNIPGIFPALPECEVKTLLTSEHTAFHVRSFWYGRAGIGRSTEEGLVEGRHEKARVRCPCSRLAELHGDLRTLLLLLY